MNHPLVSVVIPAYNAEQFIKDAVISVINQTYSNLEIIIINDGSTDGTSDICSYLRENFENVFTYDQKKSGISAALNLGVRLSKGEYIARMDADDISLPNRISRQIEFLEDNLDVDLVSTSYIPFYDSDNRTYLSPVVHSSNFQVLLLLLCVCSPFCHPAVMARKRVFKENPYRLDVLAEDHELWCRLSKSNKLSNIQEPLLLYRKSKISLSSTKNKKILLETLINGLRHFFNARHSISKIKFSTLKESIIFFPTVRWVGAVFYWALAHVMSLFELNSNHT
jgi:glycosyltransferase involved in cell wall biosynthesis